MYKRKNRYLYRSRISEAKFRQIIRLVALDLEAIKISVLTGISRNSINRILKALRNRITQECEKESIRVTRICLESKKEAIQTNLKKDGGSISRLVPALAHLAAR